MEVLDLGLELDKEVVVVDTVTRLQLSYHNCTATADLDIEFSQCGK